MVQSAENCLPAEMAQRGEEPNRETGTEPANQSRDRQGAVEGDGTGTQTPALAGAGKSGMPWAATWVILLSLSAVGAAAMVAGVRGKQGFFLPVLAMAVALLAALFDGWTRRIPNALAYPAILLGLALNFLSLALDHLGLHTVALWIGAAGWQDALAGFSICAALGLFGSFFAGVHGGDVKLLAAIGAMLGFWETANVLLIALVGCRGICGGESRGVRRA